MPDDTPGIEIDGKPYPIPRLEDITLDEERILYIYADTVLSDFVPAHPDADEEEQKTVALLHAIKVRNPDFKRALVHIAYRRANPELDDKTIEEAVGKANAFAVDLELIRGDKTRPPATSSQKPRESRSSSSGRSKSSDSGSRGENDSGRVVGTLGSTGTFGSATSSPESLATTSAGS